MDVSRSIGLDMQHVTCLTIPRRGIMHTPAMRSLKHCTALFLHWAVGYIEQPSQFLTCIGTHCMLYPKQLQQCTVVLEHEQQHVKNPSSDAHATVAPTWSLLDLQ